MGHADADHVPSTTLHWLRENRAQILQTAARHGAGNVRVFGSVVRGQDSPDSDVDLLVTAGRQTSSWFPVGLVLDLESLLGRRVEVVTDAGLSPFVREEVLREAVAL